MGNYLVKFKTDWGDEFDVYGFAFYADIDKESIIQNIEKGIKNDQYFGTNEVVAEGEITLDDFDIIPITDNDISVLEKLFPESSFGHFPSW